MNVGLIDACSSAVLFTAIAVWFLMDGTQPKTEDMGSTQEPLYVFETVPGYFQQDDPETDLPTFDYVGRLPNPRNGTIFHF